MVLFACWAGASVALASTYVVAAGATAALGMNLMFSWSGKGPKDKRPNFAQNKEIDYFQKKYGFDNKFRRFLHDEITGQGYTKEIIEQIIRDMLGLPPY